MVGGCYAQVEGDDSFDSRLLAVHWTQTCWGLRAGRVHMGAMPTQPYSPLSQADFVHDY